MNREMHLTSTRNCYRTCLPGAGGFVSSVNASCAARIGHQKQRNGSGIYSCVRAASGHTRFFHSNSPVRPAMPVLRGHLSSPRPVSFRKETLLGGNPHWNGKTVCCHGLDCISLSICITVMPLSVFHVCIAFTPDDRVLLLLFVLTVSFVRHRATEPPPLSMVAPTFVVVCLLGHPGPALPPQRILSLRPHGC